ncbi:DUF4919 domain-containing protein [Flavobacterium agricola]|uniref:DUF4919 domain-containing protein n=1 Tax=Flavobacterium agricola TaxID=2870839 RepID=A0ABY6LY15_9FLAO|nr:DUF4919 domain-containing protein [Flavobacterium agricola]UYW01222.1 DUF4919 domain-containing protein [Flavobacterium agricola]
MNNLIMNELVLLTEFWKNQTVTNYLNCQNYLYQSKNFDPFEKYLDRLQLDYENKNHHDFIAHITETMQLSLFVLDKLSKIYKEMDNKHEAVNYFTKAAEVAEVILSTGDGTRDFPYQIIYPSDCKEVLLYLQEEYYKHATVNHNNKKLEVVITKSNKEFYFDITDLQICKEKAVSEKVEDMLKWFERNTNRPL